MPTTITRRTTGSIDFGKFAQHNFAVFGSDTPPDSPVDGMLWLDTSLSTDHVMKYFDASPSVNDFVRMDGGGDLPNGLIVDRHVASNAAIQISKIAGLQAALDAASSDTELAAEVTRAEAAESVEATTRGNADSALSTRIDNLGTSLTGSYVTLDTDQSVTGTKTFTHSPVVPDATTATQTVAYGQLTAETAARTSGDSTNAIAIGAETTRATGVEGGLNTRLGTAEGTITSQGTRLSTAENDIDALQADLDAEVGRAEGAEGAETLARGAADTALGTRITDETAARIAGDEGVSGDLADEVTRATGAEDVLDGRLDTAEVALGTVNSRISTAVATETTRATGAESALDGRIDTLEGVDNFTQAEFNTFNTANTTALAGKADLGGDGKLVASQMPFVRTSEVNVVVWDADTMADADAALATITGMDQGDTAVINGGPGGAFIYTGTAWIPLSSGASAATDAEVAAAVAAEAALRLAADNALDTRVDALEAVDYATQVELDTAVGTLEGADTALGARITNEVTARTDGDATNAAALATEVADRTAGDATNATAVTTEATTRANADTALSGRITTEVSDRAAADTSIRTDFAAGDATNAAAIAAEATARGNADTTLQTHINDEATARGDADTTLGGRIDDVVSDLAAEVTDRTAGDATLQSEIDGINTALGTSSTDLSALTTRVTATETKNTAQDGRLTTLETGATTEAAARASGDSTLQSELDTLNGDSTTVGSVAHAVAVETAARSSADTSLNNSITAEATNRANADTVITGLITDEATARIAGDNASAAATTALGTAVRSEFAAADTSIRTDFAAADSTLLTNINTRALDANTVHKTGPETVGGTKTFTSPVGVPDGVAAGDAVNLAQLEAAQSDATYDDTAVRGLITTAQAAADAAQSDVDGFEATKGQANGLASLGSDGKVPTTQLPALALTNVTYAADTAVKDALTGMDEGDVVIVGDDGGVRASFIYDGTAWLPLSSPADVTEAELAAAVSAGLAIVNARIDGLAFGNGGTRTGDTFNVVGTADRIVANANSVDIASTYAGQSSIVTTGTITSGAWNASVIPLAYGGTGFPADDIAALVTYLNIGVTGMKGYSQKLTDMVHGTPFEVVHSMGTKNVVTSLYSDTTGEEFFGTGIIDRTTDSVTIVTDPTFPDPEDLVLVLVGVPVDVNGYSTVVAAEFIGEMGL